MPSNRRVYGSLTATEGVVRREVAPSTAPPPEPAMPNWGSYTQPESVPVALPPIGYQLAGPPQGVIQQNNPPEYAQIVADPNTLPAIDGNITAGIDIYRPDGLAPMGVRGDHTLQAGRIIFSMRHDQSIFDNLMVGSHGVSTASVLTHYPFVPTRLFQNHATALLEYGFTDDFTFLITLPFEHSRLDYATAGGPTNTGFTEPGDVTLNTQYVLFRRPGEQLHLNFGLSTATGFLDSLSDQPSSTFPNLPYVIRTGTGSYQLLPGMTYRGQNDLWTWGVQASANVPLGLNRASYEVGNQVNVTGWLSRRWTSHWGTSVRLDYQNIGNVHSATRGSIRRCRQSTNPNSKAPRGSICCSG